MRCQTIHWMTQQLMAIPYCRRSTNRRQWLACSTRYQGTQGVPILRSDSLKGHQLHSYSRTIGYPQDGGSYVALGLRLRGKDPHSHRNLLFSASSSTRRSLRTLDLVFKACVLGKALAVEGPCVLVLKWSYLKSSSGFPNLLWPSLLKCTLSGFPQSALYVAGVASYEFLRAHHQTKIQCRSVI